MEKTEKPGRLIDARSMVRHDRRPRFARLLAGRARRSAARADHDQSEHQARRRRPREARGSGEEGRRQESGNLLKAGASVMKRSRILVAFFIAMLALAAGAHADD